MKIVAPVLRILFFALFLFLIANGNMMIWLAFFAISLVVALLFGRLYCGYACPMNTLMIPMEWLSKRLKIQSSHTPKWLMNGIFSWVFLAVSIISMLSSKMIFQINLPILAIWLVLSVLVTIRYKPAVFHNLICPFGALQRVAGRFARFTKKVDSAACIGCKLCEKACPSRAIAVLEENKKAVISQALCHQCTNCTQVCPKSAIHYGRDAK